jgi:3-deoxy-D-manno-octulosonic-acid transferase
VSNLSRAIFFFIYRKFLWPLLYLVFRILGFFKPKVQQGLLMRRPSAPTAPLPWLNWPQAQKPVWIHCASGEFEYAKPVITRLKNSRPDLNILVTYFSPSIAKSVKNFPGVDFACPLPWDTPRSLQKFISWHRPQALLIARTDTWPEMLAQAKKAGVPTLLFSATLPANSGRARGIGRWMSRASFSYLDQIFCVSPDDRAVFASLGFDKVTNVSGDTRYDQVTARLLAPQPIRHELFKSADRNRCLVAGSTWPEDEAVLSEVARLLRDQISFILVPHEPTEHHLAQLESQFRDKGLTSVRYSTAASWPAGAVLLVDKIGILAELYQQGRFAFVGGSFRKTVHSVMEPLAAGCITFVGPLHTNNREAIEFRSISIEGNGETSLHCVESAENADVFALKLRAAVQLPLAKMEFIRAQIKSRSGKSDSVVSWCLARLQAL